MFRIFRLPPIVMAVFLILFVLTACGNQSTPPAGHSVFGTLDGRAGYLLLHWPEGLRIMIWDDLPHGAHNNGSSSSSGDPVFHMDGGAQGPDGRGYDYILESKDGFTGAFSIDGNTYDLARGKLFFIRTTGGETWVEQLDIDLSGLETSNAGVEAFGRYLPEVVAFAEGNEPPLMLSSNERAAPSTIAEPPPATGVMTRSNPALERVVAVVLSNDREARRELVQFSTAGCMFMESITGPPKCSTGMDEGTPLEYFPFRLLPGESQPVPPQDIDLTLDFDATLLYAAYREKEISGLGEITAGDGFGLIFEAGDEAGWRIFTLFHLNEEGQIIQLDEFGCRLDEDGNITQDDFYYCPPESILERDAIEVLVRPPASGAGPKTISTPDEPMPAAPTPMTPTPAVKAALPQVTRPLYFLTSELPTSSVIGDGHGLWVLEPGSPAVKRITPEDQHVTAVDLQQTDGRIAYGTGDGAIFLLEPDNQARLIYTHPAGEQGELPSIGSLSWSPDGEWLAFTAAYQDDAFDNEGGGLWLFGLEGETVSQLINNRHLQPGEADVSVVRQIIDVDYSPDGSALMLQASYWEYMDTLWLWPLGAGPAEDNIHDTERLWRDGAWTADGRSIILSGWDMAAYSDLAQVDIESGMLTRLVDGEAAGLLISNAQQLPEGIVFVGAGSDPDSNATRTRLYQIGQAAGGEEMFRPVWPDRELCSGGFVMDIAWDPAGNQAVVSCFDGVELIAIDGSSYADLMPILESIPGNNGFEVFWGSR